MKVIRHNVFETNSSSTHSLCICTDEQYDKWVKGQILYDDWNETFAEETKLTPGDYEDAEVIYESCKNRYSKEWKDLSEEDKTEYTTDYVNRQRGRDSDEFMTYDQWCVYHNDLVCYKQSFTTPSGDKMVAFGYYGYDG